MDSEAEMGQDEKIIQVRRQAVASLVISLQGKDKEDFIKAVVLCYTAFGIQISQMEVASNRVKWEKLYQAWHDSSLSRVVSDVELETGRGYGNFLVYTIRDDSFTKFIITAGPCSNPNPTMHVYERKRVLPGFFNRFSKDIAGSNSSTKFTVDNQGKYTITRQHY